jgi:hypothetical protein
MFASAINATVSQASAMSLPGGWTDDAVYTAPLPKPVPQKPRRQFHPTNYSDPAVTQFCDEHVKDLDDLHNIDQLIASLTEQQTTVTAKVIPLLSMLTRLRNQKID